MDIHKSEWLALRDQICVITGAASGIGAGTARAMFEAGAKVILLDRDDAQLQQVAKAIDPEGRRSLAHQCDVTDDVSVQSATAAVEQRFGAAQILVNNAGIIRPGALATIAMDDWRDQLDVNLNGYFRCAQAFGKVMLAAHSGAIVHIASIAAHHPQLLGGAYAPAKAAIVMLSRQLAIEWGPLGIRSNTISPGLVRTPMTEASYTDPALLERRQNIVPLRRMGTVEDIANAALFLASPRASYINGQDLVVDGGIIQTMMSHIPRADHGRQQTRV